MNKQLTLIRHAKSSWGDNSLPDYARELNKRGQNDALQIGEALHERRIKFDQVLCSSAIRARQTLSRLNEALGLDDESICYLDDLYCAPVTTLLEIIQQVDNSKHHIAIIAHNPGLEDLATRLSNERKTFSTCSVMQIEFNMQDWRGINRTTGTQRLFLSPKTI